MRRVYYGNFDYLRIFLAVEVAAGHFYSGLGYPGYLWMPIPPVAAFIALSGFLIPQSLARSGNVMHFARKRVLRTIPALIPLIIAISIIFGPGEAGIALVQYATAGYVGMFKGVTLPLWSLGVEDALYICAALLYVFGFVESAPVISIIVVMLCALYLVVSDPVTAYRILDTSLAFFTGWLIYLFHGKMQKMHFLLPAGILCGCLLGMFNFIGHASLALWVGSVIVLMITLPQINMRIPDLSYGIYIWHAPIFLALLDPIGMARDALWVTASSLLTIMISTASWYFVEKPALRFKNSTKIVTQRTA